jgi:hypothetical protein
MLAPKQKPTRIKTSHSRFFHVGDLSPSRQYTSIATQIISAPGKAMRARAAPMVLSTSRGVSARWSGAGNGPIFHTSIMVASAQIAIHTKFKKKLNREGPNSELVSLFIIGLVTCTFGRVPGRTL